MKTLTLWLCILMIGALRVGTTGRNAMCNALVDLLDAGAGPGVLLIRTSTQPTNVGDSDTGTLLGTLTFSDPAFGNASTGVATASAITSDSSADNSGAVGHARLKDSDLNVVMDCTCAQGSGDINFDNGTVVAGGVLAVTSMTVTVPI